MTLNKRYDFIVFAILLVLLSGRVFAAKPLFSLIPTTTTKVQVPANGIATVSYTVTNNTQITRTLTVVPMNGITQAAGGCTSPFTLAAGQSCLLTLLIDGATIADTINDGPQVCKTMGNGNNNPSPFLCSQPAISDRLMISKLSGNTAIISVNPTALNLVAGSGTPGNMMVTNISTLTLNLLQVTAQNIVADLPTGFNDVTQDASACTSLAPGASCQLIFTPGANPHATAAMPVMGSNTNQVNVNLTVTPPNPANISVNGSPLTLVAAGGAGNLMVNNNSLVTVTNVSAQLAGTALAGNVTQDASACNSIPAGGSCNLVFTPGVNAVPSTTVNIAGSNTNVVMADIAINAAGGGGGTGIGSSKDGGVIGCQDGAPFLNLIVNPSDASPLPWAPNETTLSGANDLIDGASNTNALLAAYGNPSNYAALFCSNYEIDSVGNMPCQAGNTCYTDWFLPAIGQLACLRTNQAAIGGFSDQNYWSSNEFDQSKSLSLNIITNAPGFPDKSTANAFRCVRAYM